MTPPLLHARTIHRFVMHLLVLALGCHTDAHTCGQLVQQSQKGGEQREEEEEGRKEARGSTAKADLFLLRIGHQGYIQSNRGLAINHSSINLLINLLKDWSLEKLQ